MLTIRRNFIALAMLFVVLTGRLSAQTMSTPAASTPRTLSWQGVISATEGHSLTGEHSLTVTLYSDLTGLTKVWQGTTNALLDASGLFNCALGTADNPLPEAAALDKPLWIGTAIDGGSEMRPLAQITASAYALNVADNSITSTKLAKGAVTADKLGMDYVSSITVNGEKVTRKGTPLNIQAGNGLEAIYDPGSNSVMLSAGISSAAGSKGANTLSVNGPNWNVGGNTHLAVGLDNTTYLGTIGADALWIRVNAGAAAATTGTAMRFVPATSGPPNVIGGDITNTITNNLFGGDFTGGGFGNTIRGTYGAIVAGDTNTIDTLVGFSAIAGGSNNEVVNDSGFTIANFVGAGENNKTRRVGSSVTSGHYNIAGSDWSAVTAGAWNEALGIGSYVGAGANDTIRGTASAAVAGEFNEIDTSSRGSLIGAGFENRIDYGSWWSAIASGADNTIRSGDGFIGSGEYNLIDSLSLYSAISSGESNQVLSSSDHALIGSGYQNRIDANSPLSAILGGTGNLVLSGKSSIAGGETDTIDVVSTQSFIGGGHSNYIGDSLGVIGGGSSNKIEKTTGFGTSKYSAVLGGLHNIIKVTKEGAEMSEYSSIVGGDSNAVHELGAFIGGGRHNYIDEQFSTIVGGDTNLAFGLWSFIGGGERNVDAGGTSTHNVIVGGKSNFLASIGFAGAVGINYSTIGGGVANTIRSDWSGIAGGNTNRIMDSAEYSHLGGGLNNLIDTLSPYSALGGGRANRIASHVSNATIPGGDSLIAMSYAQTVVGYDNVAAGSFTKGTSHVFATSGPQDQPLFIVGNGDDASHRSNAFEVSYDGHSVVQDINNNTHVAFGRSPVYGGTYQDNTVIAWGDVTAAGGISADFGVQSVVHPSIGTYVITLSLQNAPVGGFTQASVTVTIRNNDTTGVYGAAILKPGATLDHTLCGKVDATELGIFTLPNVFVVHTRQQNDCALDDRPFFFKVCGR